MVGPAERLMRRYFQFVTDHPVAVLAAMAIVGGVLGACLLGLRRDPSPDAFIPIDHPALALKAQVEEDFGLAEPIVVGVFRDGPGGVFHVPTLRLLRDLTAALTRLDGVADGDVMSIASEWGVFFEDGEPGFRRLMAQVPDEPASIAALRRDVLGYELYRGTLVAADGTAACIVVRPAGDHRDDDLYRRISRIVAEAPRGDAHIVVAGEAAVRAHMGAAVSDDALRMNFICPLIMAGMIALAYRTGRGAVLPMCVIGGASAMALGLMAACRVPIYIVTNGIFVVIMALGVADSLHLIGQYDEEQLDGGRRSRKQIVVAACMALWFPLLATTLTDITGFLALYFAGVMPPIRYFGLFTSLGVLGALVYSFTVVPAGLVLLPLRPSRAIARPGAGAGAVASLDGVGRAMAKLGRIVWRRRGLVLAAGAAAIALAAWGASGLVINDARILAFKPAHPIVRATDLINERFDGTSHLNIVVTAREPGALLRPDVLRRIAALEAFSETLPFVGGTHAVSGWVKRAHQKMNDEREGFYRIPDDPAEVRFYLDTISAPASPMSRSLLEVVDRDYSRANLIVRMTSSQYIHQRGVVEAIGRYLQEHFNDDVLEGVLAGRVNLDYEWLKVIRSSHIRSVCISSLSVLLLTGLMFRSAIIGLLCTLTVGVAVLVNYAVMGLAGIPLGVGTSMFASIAIGAGVNAPIHMLDRLRIGLRRPGAEPAAVFERAVAFTGRALLFTALVVAVGFLLLCVSRFLTLVRFGLLVAMAMMSSFLVSVTLLPALVAVCRPRSIWGK